MIKHTRRTPLYIAIYLIAALFVVFLTVWGASLAKCELLTRQYYGEFELAYQNNTMITDVEYFKVLSCDEKTAEVYYVSDACGNVVVFENQNGAWIESEWRTVWSKSGSASGVVWPYLWQFFITGS